MRPIISVWTCSTNQGSPTISREAYSSIKTSASDTQSSGSSITNRSKIRSKDKRRISNKNTRQSHRAIKVYQDIDAWTRTVKLSVYINNSSLQTRSQHAAEIQQESSRLLETFEKAEDILESYIGKDILGHSEENLEDFKNVTEAEEKKKLNTKSLINGWRTY